MASPPRRTHPVHGVSQALEQLERLPGGPEVLRAARRRDDIALVGGALRDLLLEHWPREIDVTVAADAAGLARALADAISPSERFYGRRLQPSIHERFGTASLAWSYGRIDIAELRAESYPAPGALPVVRPGTAEEDLARRDFTVNAMSVALAGPRRGELLAVEHALDDLKAGLLRVLHERSFIDDPTRLLRLARYAARLGFDIEPQTRELAHEAIAQEALRTVSGGRIGAELWLAAQEADARASLRALDELGVLASLGMPSPFDDALAAEAQQLLPPDGQRAVLVMGTAFRSPQRFTADGRTPAAGPRELMAALEFSGEQVQAVGQVAEGADALAEALLTATRPAEAFAALEPATPETVALAGAIAARRGSERGADIAREWLRTLRHVRLEINGSDLLAAGVPQGPEIGARLDLVLARKRQGEIDGREQELKAALECEVREGTSPRS